MVFKREVYRQTGNHQQGAISPSVADPKPLLVFVAGDTEDIRTTTEGEVGNLLGVIERPISQVRVNRIFRTLSLAGSYGYFNSSFGTLCPGTPVHRSDRRNIVNQLPRLVFGAEEVHGQEESNFGPVSPEHLL